MITRTRAGDMKAFACLYRRHVNPARALARQFNFPGVSADDLVSEAFARVLSALVGGGGPDLAFRAYLFTTLRRVGSERGRKDRLMTFVEDTETVVGRTEECARPTSSPRTSCCAKPCGCSPNAGGSPCGTPTSKVRRQLRSAPE